MNTTDIRINECVYASNREPMNVFMLQADELKPVYRLPPPNRIKREDGYGDSDLRVSSPIPQPEEQYTLDEIYAVRNI